MVDSKFLSVRALVQSGSLTNLATTSPWTVTHSGGTGLTLTSASRITAESLPNGKPAALCSEVVVTLDTSLIGSTVLSSGRATLVVVSTGQLRCLIDGSQVDVLNIPLAGQRVLCAIEYTTDAGNENYFFRATGETSGGTVTETASVVATAPPGGSTAKVIVGGGTLVGTVPATPAQGSVSVAITRAWAAATAVPHIIEIKPHSVLDGRTAAATSGRIIAYASINGSVVTYDLENIAGMTVSAIGAALANGIATASNVVVGSVGGVVSTVGGKSRLTTATNAAGQNWHFWCAVATLAVFPAEPGYPQIDAGAGGNIFTENTIQTGVYGTSTATTQTNAITLTLPSASATMTLSVSALPTLSVSASMANIATGLNSLTAQLGAAGFTATWQQTSGTQYVISTERTTGSLTLSAGLTVDASSIPNPVTALHALRVTASERYTLTGVPAVFPTLPWPTTNIPPPQNFSGDVTLGDSTGSSAFFAEAPKQWGGSTTADSVTSTGTLMSFEPTVTALEGAGVVDGVTSLGSMEALYPVVFSSDTVTDGLFGSASEFIMKAPTSADAAIMLPSPFVTSSATTRSPAGSVLTLPALTAVIRGGHRGAATLPALTVSAQVTTTQMLRAQVTLPALTVVSTARVSGQGAVQGFVPALSATAQGGHQARAQLPGLSATAHAVSGVTARVQGVLPRITAYAAGYREDTMRAAVTLPALVMTTSGKASIALPRLSTASFGQPVVTASHEAYVVNLNQPLDDNPRNNFEAKNQQVTRYTNWPFFQVVRLGDAYYGVAEDGLYELGGATDNGTAIAWNFETCKTDFKDPHRKAVASAYIGGQAGPELTYTLRSGDDTDRMYDYITTKTGQKRNHRQKFGLGRRVRYYSFGLAGDGTAAIDSIEFELLTTTRRV